MSRLPNGLPMSFGDDSPFPPMSSPQIASGFGGIVAGSSRPRPPPPLPPSREEALQREQQLRQQQYWQQQQHHFSARPGQLVSQQQQPVQNGGMGRTSGPVYGGSGGGGGGGGGGGNQRIMSPRPDVGSSRIMSPHSNVPFAQTQNTPVRTPSHFARPMPMPMPMPSATPQPVHASGAPRISTPAQQQSLSGSFDSLHIRGGSQTPYNGEVRRGSYDRPTSSASSSSHDQTGLSIKLPDVDELRRRRDAELNGPDDRRKALWCKDVLKFVERKLDGNRISDPVLVQMVDQAINLINRLATAQPPLAEALFLRGDLLATGSFPSYHPRDLRTAFNDFELSARMGYAPSWFRIGRDYEVLEDMARARDAYERGCSVQDVGCIYRLGMANLLGQLELSADHTRAIPLIREAADLANIDTPQPSFVYGMLLAGEFNHVQVAKQILLPNANVNQVHLFEGEARKRIQRAAYLNFAPAQLRMGFLHEHAQLECDFDPLLSVQYYSLASQGGEVEADLALSKWFLCGAEGCFEKNESLAFTFADKAAAKGLPSAEFAMGYYFEVGVGCEKELDVAKKWYRKAASSGNEDAKQRIEALQGPDPSTLSRTQHEVHVDTQLQRKRTEAKMLSDRRSMRAKVRTGSAGSAGGDRPSSVAVAPPPLPLPSMPTPVSQKPPIENVPQRTSMEVRRRNTMRLVEETSQQSHGQPNSRFSQLPAITQPVPMPTQTPPPSSHQRFTPAQQQPQFTTPPSNSRQNRPVERPAQIPSTHNSPSGAPAVGGPRRGSDTPIGRANKVTGTSPGKPTPTTSAKPNSIPVLSAPSMGPDTKVYETFGEMGFKANAAKSEKDCVIC